MNCLAASGVLWHRLGIPARQLDGFRRLTNAGTEAREATPSCRLLAAPEYTPRSQCRQLGLQGPSDLPNSSQARNQTLHAFYPLPLASPALCAEERGLFLEIELAVMPFTHMLWINTL